MTTNTDNFSQKISIEKLSYLFNYTSQDYRYFKIPEWQRNYAWTEQNIKELFTDLYTAFQNAPEKTYFLGSMIVIPITENSNSYYEIIDGQQRLTTLTMLISLMNDLLEDSTNSYIVDTYKKKGQPVFIEMVHVKLVDAEFFKPFLLQKEKKFERFDQINIGELPGGQQKMLNAFKVLRNELKNIKQELIDFRDFVLEKAYILKILVNGDHEMALTIFNSINNRGSQLCEYDLIKAQFKDPKEQEKWTNLEDPLTKCGEKGVDNFQALFNFLLSIETNFKDTVLNKKTIDYFLEKHKEKKFTFYSEEKDKNIILKMILEFGEILKFIKFFNIWDSKDDKDCDQFIKYNQSEIQKLLLEEAKLLIAIQFFIHERPYNTKMSTRKLEERILPMILFFYWKNKISTNDSDEDRHEILEKRIKFLMQLEKLLIYREMVIDSKDDTFEDASQLLQYIKDEKNLTSKFNENSLETFISHKFYGSKYERFKAKYLLFRCELFMNPSLNGICQATKKGYKIECLNPQPPKRAEWKDKLGNLMIIEAEISNTIRDMNYEEKRDFFKKTKSKFITTNQAFELSEVETKFTTTLFYERNSTVMIYLSRAFELSINLKQLKKPFKSETLSDTLKGLFIEEEITLSQVTPDKKRKLSQSETPTSNKRVHKIPIEVEEALVKFETVCMAHNKKLKRLPNDVIEPLLFLLNQINEFSNNQIRKEVKERLMNYIDEKSYQIKMKDWKTVAKKKKRMESVLFDLKILVESKLRVLLKENQSDVEEELKKSRTEIELMSRSDLFEYATKFDIEGEQYFSQKDVKDLFKKALRKFEKFWKIYYEFARKYTEVSEDNAIKSQKEFREDYFNSIIDEMLNYFPKDTFTRKKLKKRYEIYREEQEEEVKERKDEYEVVDRSL